MDLTESQKVIYRALDDHTNDLKQRINDYLDQTDITDKKVLLINGIIGAMHRSQYELIAQVMRIIEEET